MDWRAFIRGLLGTIALITVILVASTAGALGYLGDDMKDFVQGTYRNIDAFLQIHEKQIDRFWKMMGALGTILSVGFAIYKWWHGSEANFPYRLAEFLQRNDARLRAARPELASLAAMPMKRSIDAPVCLVGPLNDAFNRVRLGKAREAEGGLTQAIELGERQMNAHEAQAQTYRNELGTAHLLKAIVVSAQAGMDGRRAGRDAELAANAHFRAALRLNDKDNLARYYWGLHLLRLGQVQAALEQFLVVANGAAGQDDVASRACYYAARIYVSNGSDYNANLMMIRGVQFATADLGMSLELARMHVFHAEIRERLGYFGVASSSYLSAEEALRHNSSREASDLVDTVRRRQALLQQRQLPALEPLTETPSDPPEPATRPTE